MSISNKTALDASRIEISASLGASRLPLGASRLPLGGDAAVNATNGKGGVQKHEGAKVA